MGRMFASKIWVHIFGRAYLFIYFILFFLGGGGAYYRNFMVLHFLLLSEHCMHPTNK